MKIQPDQILRAITGRPFGTPFLDDCPRSTDPCRTLTTGYCPLTTASPVVDFGRTKHEKGICL